MHNVEFEAANIIAPLGNTPSGVFQAAIPFAPDRTEVIDLHELFGPDGGHIYTIQARGALAFVKAGHASGPMELNLTAGSGTWFGFSGAHWSTATGAQRVIRDAALGYPLADGQEKHFRITSIREPVMYGSGTPSGSSPSFTTMSMFRMDKLHVRSPSGGGTGMLHIYRSSLAITQSAENFKGTHAVGY